MSGYAITVVVLVVIVLAACVVLSRIGVVGPTALQPLEPAAAHPPGARASADGDGVVALWRVCGPIAIVGAVGAVAVVASTFLPDSLAMPRSVVATVAVGAFLLLVLAVATVIAMRRRRRRSVLSTIESVAPDAWPLAAVVVVMFGVVWLTSLGAPSGDPMERDGRYYLNNHAVLTEITRDEYERYETLSRRGVAALTGALYCPGIVLGLYAHGVAQRSTT
jgi:amino acid transporter